MDKKLERIILNTTNSTQIIEEDLLQKLWSGYGELSRVKTDKTSVIVKRIQFPTNTDHPKGWSGDFAHKRKIKSYKVEMNWYKNYNSSVDSYSPKFHSCGNISKFQYIILEDLEELGFKTKESISYQEIKNTIKWLANFHGKYLNTKPEGLWDTGTYWHLATRPDELEALKEKNLKSSAKKIDKKLNSCKYQTLVHGDAKLANFLYQDESVAAVDFQYVGGGVGVKDFAYFLSSVLNSNELFEKEKELLDFYFMELRVVLNDTINKDELETMWRKLYSYAWCDLYRFLKGWSPTHYKLNSYIENISQKVLDEVKEP